MSDGYKELGRRLRRLEEGVKAQNQPQLAHSSVEDGAIEHYDADGQLTAIVGRQHDDTVAPIVVTGPTPPAPTGLDVVGGQLQVTASWDGTWADGQVAPMDFARVEVHVGSSQDFEPDPLPSSSTRVATIEAAGGASVTWQAEPGEVWVTIIARTLPGKVSEHREIVSVEVTGAVDPEVFEQLKTDLAASEQAIADRMHEIETMLVDGTRITPGSIYAPKLDANSLGALVAQILQLDVSHLIAGDAKIGDAVIAKLTAQILAAHKITADDIDVGKITAAVAELVRIKAEQIDAGFLNATIGIGTTGAIIAGDWSKVFARMDQTGFSTWMVTEDGTQVLCTALGSTVGADALMIADSTGRPVISGNSDGSFSALDLDVDGDPTFAGRPLLGKRLDPADDGILDDGPRGVVPGGFGDFRDLIGGGKITNQEATLGGLNLDVDPDRMFQVTMPYAHYFTPDSGKNGTAAVILRYTYGDNPPDPTASSKVLVSSGLSYSTATPTAQAGAVFGTFNSPESLTSTATFKILVTAKATDGTMAFSVSDGTQWKMLVLDVGRKTQSTARVAASLPSQTTQTGGSTTGTVTPKQTYTATWIGTASQAYTGSGSKIIGWTGSAKGLLQQGNPGDAAGNRRSLVAFTGPSLDAEKKTMDAALTGATITKAEVFLKFPHWWYSNGGEARVHPAQTSSILDTLPDSVISSSTVTRRFTARGQGAWIQIPTDWAKNGMRSIVVGPASGAALTNYGYFCGPSYATVADRVKLRLTYTR